MNKSEYLKVHRWVVKHKGYPQVCVDCGAHFTEVRLQWSNIDHTYRKVLNDYQARCGHCHRSYDKANAIEIFNLKNRVVV